MTFFVVKGRNLRNTNQVTDSKRNIVCGPGEGMRGVNLVF